VFAVDEVAYLAFLPSSPLCLYVLQSRSWTLLQPDQPASALIARLSACCIHLFVFTFFKRRRPEMLNVIRPIVRASSIAPEV
jgi:hypothetical protein